MWWNVEMTQHGDEWSVSRPGHFTPGEEISGTLWIGECVGPRACLDAVAKRKINTLAPLFMKESLF